jgi:TM2 domain-containing membrane protein YozV
MRRITSLYCSLIVIFIFDHFHRCFATNSSDHRRLTECKNIDAGSKSIDCKFNNSCVYGQPNTIQCSVAQDYHCHGDRSFKVTFPCLYCWQLPDDAYNCTQNTTCKANTRYRAECRVNATTFCLGNREFERFKQCNIVTGHKWSMAFVLSVLFGGFGVDRFYLGHWQEGVGKLFSFGGFGIWTLIDTILISIGYLKPADSSHYEL